MSWVRWFLLTMVLFLAGGTLAQDGSTSTTKGLSSPDSQSPQTGNTNTITPEQQNKLVLEAIQKQLLTFQQKQQGQHEQGGLNLQKLLASESAQKFIEVISHPKVLKSLGELMDNMNYKRLFLGQIGLLVAMVFLSSWMQAKTTNWAQKLLANLTSFVVYSLGAIIIAPSIALGRPYLQFLSAVFEVAAR